MSGIEYRKNLPIKVETDVFIAGGGPAGVAAAVSCAKMGAKVFLAEASGTFGGMGTLGLVPELMNFDDGEHFLAEGFGRKIHKTLFGEEKELSRKTYVVKVEEVKRLYDKLMQESGAEFSFFTNLIDVVKSDEETIEYAVLSAKSGIFAVKAKIYIDCTGDGDLSNLAGAECILGADGKTMPATLPSMWANVDFSKKGGRDDRMLKKAIDDGVFSLEDELLPGIFAIDSEKGLGGGNVGHVFGVDPTDERSLTKAMLWGRQSLTEYEKYYKEYLTGFEDMILCNTANVLGVRESRRVMGDYVMSRKDYETCAVFADEIGRYSYPLDIHIESPDRKAYENFLGLIAIKHGKGQSYGIPYRALTPKGLKNLLVAGKCISAERAMQASVRVTPGCYITGQAAGIAAALTAESGDVRKIDIAVLQEKIRTAGERLG
ncbi:MAG: FAD-dependent oxidoreductase [Christensenellaceae bacterium]|nr:FAD-dependent oxidoreductase [Christensenellaceae bacterium]